LDQAGVSPLWRTWAQEALLPQVYWAYQVTRTRCTRRTLLLDSGVFTDQ
jgi:hypothetical protein